MIPVKKNDVNCDMSIPPDGNWFDILTSRKGKGLLRPPVFSWPANLRDTVEVDDQEVSAVLDIGASRRITEEEVQTTDPTAC
jgi:hypothetical protein